LLAGFRARNHRQQVAKHGSREDVDDRRTLPEVFEPLAKEFGPFTVDVAANVENAKCARYYTKEQDGLAQPWADEVVWCNPPYSDIRPWVEKALRETADRRCRRVVMLLPANRCEQKWWQELVEPVRDRGFGVRSRFLPGRPRFGWAASRVVPVKGDRPPFGLVVLIIEDPQMDLTDFLKERG
jgi:phage N-6-adenine-methyltransferase